MQTTNLEIPKKMHNQQEQQESDHLKCPRCFSSNTKFCYYNNYKKSQPRHFCKGCKRHWTKGGTLRNVPLDNGRKNKRQKLSNSATHKTVSVSFGKGEVMTGHEIESSPDNIFVSSINHTPPIASSDQIIFSRPEDNDNGFMNNFTESSDTFLGSDHGMFFLASSQDQSTQFSCSENGEFGSNLTLFVPENQSLDEYEYTMPMSDSNIVSQKPWQDSHANGFMDLSSLCDWNEINSLVSADLDVPWDEA